MAALLVMLTGCYENFTPEIDTKPVLAINSLITAGEPIEVEVTHTWVYSDGWASSVNTSVEDAVVSLYANDVLVAEDYIPKQGDRIKIVANSTTYGYAEAMVTVPSAVHDVDIMHTVTMVSDWHANENWEMNSDVKFDVNINLTLTDSHDGADYYKLSFSGFTGYEPAADSLLTDSPVYFDIGTFDETYEPIFSENIGVFESVMGNDAYGVTFFTDRQFSGKAYTLHLKFADAGCNVRNPVYDETLLDCGYVLELQSVSQSYYNWLNYKWQIDYGGVGDISDLGFADPIWGYSNVSTGAGVVAARAESTYQVSLKDFLKQVISKPDKR